MKKYSNYYVPVLFAILALGGISIAGVSADFIIGELYSRFIRNGLFLLALIPPILSGMGINFSIIIGAILAQVSMVIVIDLGVSPVPGLAIAVIISTLLSIVIGNLIGYILNKSIGKEMIVSMIIGFLGTNIYLLIFMVGYGNLITPRSKDILVIGGSGVKSMLDASIFRDIYGSTLGIRIGNVNGSLIPVIIVLVFSVLMYIITKSKFGYRMKAVGENIVISQKLGVDVFGVRRKALVLSTLLASYGQLMFIQNLGILNVYTGHLNIDVFSAAALLVGGATLRVARVRNVFIGLLLFHSLFVISPIAGQNLFNNVALGEYFRSFIAYGTIVFAFVMNLKNQEDGSLRL